MRWWGAVGSGAVGVTVKGDDVGVVHQAVDGGAGDDVIAEGFTPAGERQVGRDDHRPGLIARGDELEEQRRAGGVQREVAQFVDLCGYPNRSTYADTATMPR